MPNKPNRPCAIAGCPNAAAPGSSRCEEHTTDRARYPERPRPSAAARGYDHKWRMNRARFLRQHPACAICGQPATDVDHIIPREDGGTDHWENLEPLCHSCHSRKTASVDGGFGNNKQ